MYLLDVYELSTPLKIFHARQETTANKETNKHTYIELVHLGLRLAVSSALVSASVSTSMVQSFKSSCRKQVNKHQRKKRFMRIRHIIRSLRIELSTHPKHSPDNFFIRGIERSLYAASSLYYNLPSITDVRRLQ